ncbi:hypothetical protein SAMN02745164_00426 [Marinitoga hydrogenitolerans DSM 16785]|uniref:Uncharacterized protein n=1 Tax=Marinitoga hydrogenitolerans (strain DSM 16785 / JCM 12826 / AT1271) TaxID=1122195 RepID=A0A1M4TG25_MARH1|nr:hypothetical protein [Marinitoga hydrogenitolerans]SHE43348.1 hypothetical protein SAMN02745164_00426 [Marinitoga hydrogenitolerans DSM 16785]
MKTLALTFILIGLVIILSVFWGYSLTFWKTLEFILGFILIISGINPKQKVELTKNKKKLVLEGKEAEEVIDDILDSQRGLFFKFLKKTHKNFRFKTFIFGLISGITLILDSLNIIDTNLNFWEVLLVILGSWLIASGISTIFFRGK